MYSHFFSPHLLTFLVSMLPVAELRGGLPLGISLGISPVEAYMVSIAGNAAPVVPLLLGLKFAEKNFRKYKAGERMFNFLEKKIHSKKRFIYRYGIWGVLILVALPLPFTGAWTGSIVSFFLSIPLKYSIPAIFAGICLAGMVVLFVTAGISGAGRFFFGM